MTEVIGNSAITSRKIEMDLGAAASRWWAVGLSILERAEPVDVTRE